MSEAINEILAASRQDLEAFREVASVGYRAYQQKLLFSRTPMKALELSIKLEASQKILSSIDKLIEELLQIEAYRFPQDDTNEQAA